MFERKAHVHTEDPNSILQELMSKHQQKDSDYLCLQALELEEKNRQTQEDLFKQKDLNPLKIELGNRLDRYLLERGNYNFLKVRQFFWGKSKLVTKSLSSYELNETEIKKFSNHPTDLLSLKRYQDLREEINKIDSFKQLFIFKKLLHKNTTNDFSNLQTTEFSMGSLCNKIISNYPLLNPVNRLEEKNYSQFKIKTIEFHKKNIENEISSFIEKTFNNLIKNKAKNIFNILEEVDQLRDQSCDLEKKFLNCKVESLDEYKLWVSESSGPWLNLTEQALEYEANTTLISAEKNKEKLEKDLAESQRKLQQTIQSVSILVNQSFKESKQLNPILHLIEKYEITTPSKLECLKAFLEESEFSDFIKELDQELVKKFSISTSTLDLEQQTKIKINRILSAAVKEKEEIQEKTQCSFEQDYLSGSMEIELNEFSDVTLKKS